MSQLLVNHVDYTAGVFVVTTICITAELLLLTRRWRVANRASHPHPDDRNQ